MKAEYKCNRDQRFCREESFRTSVMAGESDIEHKRRFSESSVNINLNPAVQPAVSIRLVILFIILAVRKEYEQLLVSFINL